MYTIFVWICYIFGNVLEASGSHANINPLRYRGYVYDQECDLYYLQSRYYDPKVGRFINADAYASTGQGILGHNMFAYCGNNPIVRADPTGYVYVINESDLVGAYGGGDISNWVLSITWVSFLLTLVTNENSDLATDEKEEAQAVADAALKKRDREVRFPADPYDFHPIGLFRHVCVEPGKGKNGGIIKWEIPGTKIAIFEWNEDWKNEPHYHVLKVEWKNKHYGDHYPIGSLVPEPWKSTYFGG